MMQHSALSLSPVERRQPWPPPAWYMCFLAMLALAGCAHRKTPYAARHAARLMVKSVRVISARPRFLTPLPGELRAYQDVHVRARVEGFIKRLFVDRGSWVRRGQTLAVLSAPELRARQLAADQRLVRARAQYQAARANAVRDVATLRRLQAAARAAAGAVAGNDIQIARQTAAADRAQVTASLAAVRGAAAKLRSLRALTAYLRVRAPFSGMIIQRRVSTGSLVGPSATAPALFRLQQLNPLRLVVEVPESDDTGIHAGGKVSFSVIAFPGKLFRGVIARIPESLHSGTRVMPVELNVANPRQLLDPGMYAQVRWPVRRPYPTLLVPVSAVDATTAETFVVRIVRQRIQRVSVRRGFTMGDEVEVFGKIRAGDLVARRATSELRPGQVIQIASQTHPSSTQSE